MSTNTLQRPPEDLTARVSVRLPDRLVADLQAVARGEDRSVSSLVRLAVEALLRDRETASPI